MRVDLNRQLLGLEDITFGVGTVTQTRGGQQVVITKLNAANLPFDEINTLQEVLDTTYPLLIPVGNKLIEIQVVYDNIAKVITVATELTNNDNIETVSADLLLGVNSEIRKVNAITAQINNIATDIIPNLAEILLVDERAVLAKKYAEELEDTQVEPGTYSAKHWAIKAQDIVTEGVIDDVNPSIIKTYSSNKIEAELLERDNVNVSQQSDINGLIASILALNTANAQGQFGGTSTVTLSSTEQVVPFSVITQSTDTTAFEIGTNTVIVKEEGSYSFISTVTFEDTGANGAVGTVTFNLRDTTTNASYYTQVETVEISSFDRDTVPFNSLMVIPDTVVLPITIDISVSCNITGYSIVGFNSLLAQAGGSVQTIDTIDSALGNLITGVLI